MLGQRGVVGSLDHLWRRGVRSVVRAGAPHGPEATSAVAMPPDVAQVEHAEPAVTIPDLVAVPDQQVIDLTMPTTSFLAWTEDFLGDVPATWAESGWGGDPGEMQPVAITENEVAASPSMSDEAVARRRASAAALRAVLLAQQRRYEEAQAAFCDAFSLDASMDPQGIAGFWDLDRGAQDAAVNALEDAGRTRDAMLLRAKVEARYRLRIVRTA